MVIRIPKKTYRMKSGKKVKIKAAVSGWTDKKEKDLIFFDDDGYVDDAGMFTAPNITEAEKVFQVEVILVTDPNIKEIVQIIVERIEPLKISPISYLIVFSGGEIQFTVKSMSGEVAPYWHILDNSHEMGTIDANSGKYTAPQIIRTEREITVEVLDQNTGNRALATLTLKPIEIISQSGQRIHAGEKDIQLNIQSNFDIKGLYNYCCSIISVPRIGEVKNTGIYTAPLRVQKEYEIKVLAVSLTDPSKCCIHSFQLGFPICKNCGQESGPGNCCINCNAPTAYSAYIRR